MKKLYGYLLIAAGFLTIVSCDKDSDYEAPVSSINVVSAETYLSAAGETKSIVLDNTPASVYAQDAWLTVTNEGNKVNLTAEANTSIQSRNTEVVVKRALRHPRVPTQRLNTQPIPTTLHQQASRDPEPRRPIKLLHQETIPCGMVRYTSTLRKGRACRQPVTSRI